MFNKYVIAVLAMLLPCLAAAQGSGPYKCTFGDMQRRVEIFTEPGVSVPCEVHYYKDTEAQGERQVLWSATSEAGYCETRVAEFIEKLEGWGWDCDSNGSGTGTGGQSSLTITKVDSATETESAEADSTDDTESLAPVDDAEATAEQ